MTAYDAWAVKAFEVHAVDYVMKPFEPERIAAAVERARERLRPADLPSADAVAARRGRTRPAGRSLERVVVRDGGRRSTSSRRRACRRPRAQDDYVELCSEGKAYLKAQTLASLAAALDPARFVRVHRSHLINVSTALARLEALREGRAHVAILADGTPRSGQPRGARAVEGVCSAGE